MLNLRDLRAPPALLRPIGAIVFWRELVTMDDSLAPSLQMTSRNPFESDLDRNAANYTPLTPVSLIARTAYVYPDHPAVVHGDRRYTWAGTYARARKLASAL